METLEVISIDDGLSKELSKHKGKCNESNPSDCYASLVSPSKCHKHFLLTLTMLYRKNTYLIVYDFIVYTKRLSVYFVKL